MPVIYCAISTCTWNYRKYNHPVQHAHWTMHHYDLATCMASLVVIKGLMRITGKLQRFTQYTVSHK